MHTENRAAPSKLRLEAAIGALLCAAVVAACGSSSTGTSTRSAHNVLAQTFSAGHRVTSGILGFSLRIDPVGSSTMMTPVVLRLSGPFESRGTGNLPASSFTFQMSAHGRRSSLGIISTGTHGYVSVQGAAYQLPRAVFGRLGSSFSSVGPSGTGAGVSALGLNPQHWLQDPAVAGTQTLNGAETTHIRAGVDVGALLADLNRFLSRTARTTSAPTSLPGTIPAATRQKLARSVKDAKVDIWTGSTDKTLRRLTLSLTVPVSGQTSALLGGMTSAGVSVTVQYSDLNHPQRISAPAHLQPYSGFAARLRSLMGVLP